MLTRNFIVASDGTYLPIDELQIDYAYNADNQISYAECTYNGATFRRTYTYTSGNLTTRSAWIKQ